MTAEKYVVAFGEYLTASELEVTEREAVEFAKYLKHLGRLPRAMIRHTLGNLSPQIKLGGMTSDVVKADKQRINYANVVGDVCGCKRQGDTYESRLNYRTFALNRETRALKRLNRVGELGDVFPQGRQEQWPILVLTCNSNLTSPQAFFDCFECAEQIVPRIIEADNVLIVGTYFSERHLHANAMTSIKRYTEVANGIHCEDSVTPAAEILAYQVLDLLLERGQNGSVEYTENEDAAQIGIRSNRLVLREDSSEIFKHIVGYGYSAGHLGNSDVFRLLRGSLENCAMRVHGGPLAGMRSSAETLIMGNARLIGVGGIDRMAGVNVPGSPKSINFISEGDFSIATLGPAFLRAPNVILVKSPNKPSVRSLFNAVFGDPPLESIYGGHSQLAYKEALLDICNRESIRKARHLLKL